MTKRAILIGIDHYTHQTHEAHETHFRKLPNLNGCICDVKDVKNILVQNWGFLDEHITMLISTCQENKTVEEIVSRDEVVSPSYESIISSIMSVLVDSRPGDVLYLHFSGYTMMVPTATPHVRKFLHMDMDVALLPANVTHDGRFLHDVEIAALLYKLTERRCEVTLVIDGRTLFANISDFTTFNPPELSHIDASLVSYGSWNEFGKHTWLQNPPPNALYNVFMIGGYCHKSGPLEYRKPGTLATHGFLTYRLLKLLGRESQRVTYKTFARQLTVELNSWIDDHLYLMIEELGQTITSRINGVFLGGDICFAPLPPNYPAIMSGEQDDIEMRVEGGMAHGLRNGDQLVLVEGNGMIRANELSAEGSTFGIFEVTSVRGLFSLCRPLTNMSTSHLGLMKQKSLSAILVMDSRDLPRSCRYGTKPIDTSKTHDAQQVTPSHLTIRKLSEVSPLSLQTRADLYYSLIQLKHRSDDIAKHVDFSVVGGYGHRQFGPPRTATFGSDGHLHLLSGDYVVIHLLCRLPRHMFVRILCFDSTFGIEQVYPATRSNVAELRSLRAGYKSELALHVRLSFPAHERFHRSEPSADTDHSTEVLKIFVTDSPSSFEGLEMPGIFDEAFLHQHWDPASKISTPTVPDSGYYSNDGSNEAAQEGKSDESLSEEEPDEVGNNWCCFEAKFVIHKSEDTIPTSR